MIPRRKFSFLALLLVGAVAHPEKWKTCTPESQSLVMRATTCLEQRDTGCAKLAIEQVLQRQPGCAQAIYIQSFFMEQAGREADAQAKRELAEKLDPELKKFWEERGHYIENEMLTEQEFSHFVLKFNGGGNRGNAWKAVQHLNAAYDFLVSRFGEAPPKKVEVIVFTGPEFMDAWRAPFIGGFFDRRDGKVRVRVDDFPGGDALFRNICRHEFTHAFMHQLYPKTLPLWFVEGTAEFYGYYDSTNSFWKDDALENIRKSVRYSPVPFRLSEISDRIEKKSGNAMDVYLAYQYGYALTLYVAKERGDSWIPNVLTRLRQGKPFAEAFLETVGYSPEHAYENLKRAWN